MEAEPANLTVEDGKLVVENVAEGSMARGVDGQVPSAPAGRMTLLRLAWRHLGRERESSAGVALALLLALLPAVLLFVDSAGARSDLRSLLTGSGGLVVHQTGIQDNEAFEAFQKQAQAQVSPRLGQYLDDGGATATTGPFRIDSINSRPPNPPVDTADAQAVYVSDLASRVDVVQGVMSRPGLTGDGIGGSASMPEAVADRIGVRLFDEVCLRPQAAGPGPAAAVRCVRVVGLWRPIATADPPLVAHGGAVQVFTERDEFFAMAGLQPSRSAEAARLYRPRPAAIAAQDAAKVEDRVREVRTSVASTRSGEMQTSLDADLQRFTATRSSIALPVRMLTAALIPLLVLLAGVLARWYVAPRLHDLALLRARGWPRQRVQLLVLAQFGILAAAALAATVLGLLVLAWRADGVIGPGAPAPSRGELVGVGVAIGIPLLAAAWFVGLARWASRQSVLRIEHPEDGASRAPSWRGSGLLVLPGALLLVLPRVVGGDRLLPAGAPADLGILVTSVAGLVMLVVAALPALSLVAEAHARQHHEVQWTLARWRLQRWWQRHAAAGFLIVLAFAIASFSAVWFVGQVTGGARSMGVGVAASLAIGFVTSMAAGMLAFGLVFLFAGRSRIDDYTALLVDGLREAEARRSLEIEQHTVLVEGLAVGLVLGLVLVWVSSAGAGVAASTAPVLAAGLAATAAIGLAAGAAIARSVRRATVGFGLIDRGRRIT